MTEAAPVTSTEPTTPGTPAAPAQPATGAPSADRDDAAQMARFMARLGSKATPEAKPESKPESAEAPKPEPHADGEYAANLAHLAKLDRQIKAREAKLEARAKELEAVEVSGKKLSAAQERFKAGQRAAAVREHIRETFGEDLSTDDVADLMQEYGAAPAALTEADIEKKFQALREKERADEEAAKAKAAEDLKAGIGSKEAVLVDQASAWFGEHTKDYPTVAFRGVAPQRILELVREGFKATQQIPNIKDVFDFLEQEFRAEAAAQLSFLKPEPAAPKPLRTFGAADKRGVTPASDEKAVVAPKLTLKERNERFKASLREQTAGAR